MGSYYRDNISFDSPQHHQSTFHAHDGQQQPSTSLQDSGSSLGPTRLCSVRGCTAVLPFEYSLKMCEQCRGRHRIYANTKRQKRKLEKLALGGQQGSVVWMPPDDQVDHTEEHADLQPAVEALQQPAAPEPIPPATPISEPQPPAQILAQAQQFNIPPPPTQWDNSAIDPRLFSQTPASSSSELAGALNFPGMNPTTPPQPPRTTHVSPQQVQQQAYIQQTLSTVSPSSVQSTPQALPFSPQLEPKPLSEPSHTSVPQAPPSLPFGSNVAPHVEISARAISEAAAHMPDPNLPHRYCSIKGCKAVIPGDSFFKMCEPCRNRYRNYGTTKRAKWRREKEVAVAELQNLRMEEDKRRAEHGLPPLPREEIEWQDIPVGELGSAAHATRSPFAQVVQSHTPRMCTVSHCREILPPDYEYLRCERHRVQNRHHSKLKRVRDKESKAVAFDDWAAAVNAMAQKNEVEEGLPSEEEDGEGEEERDNLEGGVASGVPPAARGSRRTNHVCSIKVCNNLLSPNNPWKMCDSCRSRDRTARKIKALRENGMDVEPLPPREKTPPALREGIKGKKKKRKKNGAENADGSQEQPEAGPNGVNCGVSMVQIIEHHPPAIENAPASVQDMPFMKPLLPPEQTDVSIASLPADGNEDGTVEPQATTAPSNTPQPAGSAPSKPPRKKRPSKKKAKDSPAEAPPTGELATVSMPPVAGPSTIPPPPPGHIQPPFHVPYYMPPPFAMPPYVPGRMGAPPAMYARDPYAPMYPPPYPYPYPYPPPPPGYAFPPPYHIPMPPSPLAQTSGSPSQTPQPPNQQPPPTQPTATTSTTAPKTPSVTASSPSPPSQPTQTMFNPFNQPLDIASMYSTFSSRPKSDKHAAGTHNNRTPYGAAVTVTVSPQPATPTSAVATSTTIMSPNSELLPPGSSLKLTFNAKTGQTYSRPEPLPGLGPPKRKRSVVDESGQGETSSKRAGACNGGEGGQTNAVAAIQPPVPPASVPGDECAEAPSSRSICNSRTCNRALPANTTSGLCEKCKGKVRKKQALVKQRFKLEPKKSNIVPTAKPADVSGAGGS